MLKLLYLLMLWGACAAAQTVEGTVINAVTGKGIGAVRVQIRGLQQSYSTTTDAQGHFRVEGVKDGIYGAGYSSPDYLPSDYSGFRRVFQVAAGGNPVKLEGRMMPVPKISGRVVDARGNGVANAQVELIGPQMSSGRTNATGKFERRLRPGSYILSVVPPVGLKPPDPQPGSDRVFVWTRTFYPGVPIREAASKIVLWPGGEVADLELKLLAVPGHAIRGIVLNPEGTPARSVAITLGEDAQGQPAHRAESKADGVFEFPLVGGGEWRLSAEVESGGVKARVTQWIEMAGRELEGVKLRLSPPFSVHGQVVLEIPKNTAAPNRPLVFLVPQVGRIRREIGMLNWMLRPEINFEPTVPSNAPDAAAANRAHTMTLGFLFDEEGAISARTDADGNFNLQNVYPGRYRIVPMPPPPPYYLAAIRVGEADLTTVEVELSSGAAPITIVYKTNGGSVRGVAEKCASGPVMLIPQDLAMQSLGYLRSVLCNPSDRFEITAVRPGEYYVLAFAGNGPLPQLNDGLLNQASKVTIRSGEASLADLRAIPRPGY